eukprot:gnl/MRDRNA2_/MRDRNA2_82599_c0_seq1.p1 gnl/MRDRNA2_/MRDRNA2_82599_c0~~gnl/MRDRNA2_/MRDRNA2_82599_c0_seq1.p1  ORF type:complete len:165 (-),score=1.55 gnl/MRDRNA2_/MRDRNA2_82599_c0_seq1:253-747(-)
MGERKVTSRYFPPDFDPKIFSREREKSESFMKIRMMMGISVQCLSCGVFIYKGTKFNMRKEKVKGEDYLGIKIHRFYFRCPQCASTITFKTDPKFGTYLLEHGAVMKSEQSTPLRVLTGKIPSYDHDTIAADVERGRQISYERNQIGIEKVLSVMIRVTKEKRK